MKNILYFLIWLVSSYILGWFIEKLKKEWKWWYGSKKLHIRLVNKRR